MAGKTALILGAGKNIGAHVAATLKSHGYSVALVSRKPDTKAAEAAGYTALAADLSKPESVRAVFKETKEKLGAPSVVVYNAAAFTFPSDWSDPFSAGAEAFVADTAVNAVGGFVSLQEAIAGFGTLDEATPKVFIATGNVLPFKPSPGAGSLGASKAALAHLVDVSTMPSEARGIGFILLRKCLGKGRPLNIPR